MDQRATVLAAIGYGSIGVLMAMIGESVTELLAIQAAHGAVDKRPYLAVADALPAALALHPETPDWADARRHFLAMVARYRDLIDCLPPGDSTRVAEVSAEFQEAMTISRIALDRLGGWLGLATDSAE